MSIAYFCSVNMYTKLVQVLHFEMLLTSCIDKKSSGDEIANVLVNDDIAHTWAYFKIPKKRQTYFV